MNSNTLIINVDDNEPTRYARSRILKGAGFQVHEAGTGRDTLELTARLAPDLVLLDVHLPDMSGIDVCRELKGMPAASSVMVVQISASALNPTHATAALDSGADVYLMEPVDPDVLVATVRAMLRLRSAERELKSLNQKLAELNSELKRSNEDLQQFAFAASHDLQEPLRNVTSFLQLIEEEAGSRLTDQERQYFAYVVSAAGRMGSLIRDLLAYSQVGRGEQVMAEVDLNSVVEWAMANLSQGIADSKATVEVAGPLPVVMGDRAQLVQVMQNLLSNAIKYRKPSKDLIVKIAAREAPGGRALVSVQDNGIGIDPAYRDRIFVPFKRLHGKEIPGNGIGLAVCRRIIEAHGGRIWAESKPGEGSEFLLILPSAE